MNLKMLYLFFFKKEIKVQLHVLRFAGDTTITKTSATRENNAAEVIPRHGQ